MKVFVTGASGFVGRALLDRLLRDGHSVVAVVRQIPADLQNVSPRVRWVCIRDIQTEKNFECYMSGCEGLVHLAARVHVVNDSGEDLHKTYESANTDAALSLAKAAEKAGIKRFVFVSSMKACGEFGTFDESWTELPQDPYGLSKRKAEIGLLDLAKNSDLEVVVLRPPLIYGPDVKANFRSLLKAVSKKIPLPLGAANNKRSLVFIGNFVDAIVQSLTDSRAANQIFFVTDGKDVSTAELIKQIATSMDVKPLLFSVPNWLFKIGLALLGKSAHYEKLFGTLVAKSEKFQTTLDWNPPYTMKVGMDETVRAFLRHPK